MNIRALLSRERWLGAKRRREWAAFLPVAAVAVLGFFAANFWIQRETVRYESLFFAETQRLKTRLAAEGLREWIARLRSECETLAAHELPERMFGTGADERFADLLERRQGVFPELSALLFLAAPENAGPPGEAAGSPEAIRAGRRWIAGFLAEADSETGVFAAPIPLESAVPRMGVAAPVFRDGVRIGTLALVAELGPIAERFAAPMAGTERETAFLLNEDGTRLYPRDPVPANSELGWRIRRMVSELSGFEHFREDGTRGDWHVAWTAAIAGRTRLVVGLASPESADFGALLGLRLQRMLSAVLLVLALLVIFLLASRHRAAAALAREREDLRRFFDTVDDMVFVLEPDGGVREINRTVTRRLGYTPAEAAGKPFHWFNPEDRWDEGRTEFRRLLGEERAVGTFPLVDRNGRPVPAETRLLDGTWRGAPVRFAVCKDLSELLESEQKFAAAFQRNPSPMIITVFSDGRILDVNPAMEETAGYSREEMVGRTVGALELYADPGQRYDLIQTLRQGGVRRKEIVFRTRSGALRDILLFSERIRLGDRDCALTACLDITELKATEARLRRASETQALLLDHMAAHVWFLVDAETYGIVNRAHAEFIGKPADDLFYRKLADLFPPEVAEVCRNGNRTAFETRAPLVTEEWLADKDGRLRLLEIAKTPKPGPDGEVEFLICVAIDRTEEHRARAALQESEARYRNVFDAASDAMFIVDAETGAVRDANPAALRLYGYARDEAIGMAADDLLVDPDRDSASENGEPGFRPLQRHRRKDGSVFHVESALSRFEMDGRPMIAASNRDISERVRAEAELRESEQRLQLALLGGDLGLWDFHVPSGRIEFNERFAAMLGFSPTELEPHADTWRSRIHPEDRERVEAVLGEHLAGRTPVYETEHRLRTRSGTYVWVLDRGRVTERDGEGAPVRMVGTHLDITERKRAETRRREMEAQAHQTRKYESLNLMAGSVAHHFNNLLMGVMGNLEIAQMEVGAWTPVGESIEAALRAARRAADLSGLMLTYVGQGTMRMGTLDLNRIGREAIRRVADSGYGNVLREFAPDDSPPMFRGDAARVTRVLADVLANALEAVADAPGAVSARTGRRYCPRAPLQQPFLPDEMPEGIYVWFEVRDTGPGMDEETVARIFDPFFTTKFTGRGLGMAAALGVIRALGGAIWIESEPGAGTTVRIYFPEAAGEDREEGHWPDEPEPDAGENASDETTGYE